MFFVLSSPRSMSYWVTSFLRSSGSRVEHDYSINCSSIKELEDQNIDGIVDTAIVHLHNKLVGNKVVLLRDKEEVLESLDKLNIDYDINNLWTKLEEASEKYPVFYAKDIVSDERKAKIFFEYLTGCGFDKKAWRKLRNVNLQRSIPEIQRLVNRNKIKIKQLYEGVI
jgi:hypothetical protein